MKEKKIHDKLLRLLGKHFDEDEEDMLDEEMGGYGEDEDYEDDMEMEDDLYDDRMDDDDMMEEEEEEEEEEFGGKLPKDKRKGLAIVIMQKKLGKPKKDM